MRLLGAIFKKSGANCSSLEMSIAWKGEVLGVLETRRHYTNYFKGIPHFKEYRTRMVTSNTSVDVFAALADVEANWGDYEMV